MAKKICFDANYFILIILIIILISYLFITNYYSNKNNNLQYNENKNNILKENDNDTRNDTRNYTRNEQRNEQRNYTRNDARDETRDETKESYENNRQTFLTTVNYPTAVIDSNTKTMNSLDRIYNPLRYPYKSDYFYDQSWYPNLEIPFQVIGCGSRNTPCLGGTQVPIYNPPVPINISNDNIAPINISTRGPLGKPQQLGVLYKINGNDNDILPLFGRRKYPNDNKYEYYTIVGQFGSKVNIVTKNRNDELGSNDIVFIKGRPSPYRVTIYESDFPQYIPY